MAAPPSTCSCPPTPTAAKIAAVDGSGSAPRYLVFVWNTTGYELREREGDVPVVGEEVEEGETRQRVTKVAPSPLPRDRRRCAYLQPLS